MHTKFLSAWPNPFGVLSKGNNHILSLCLSTTPWISICCTYSLKETRTGDTFLWQFFRSFIACPSGYAACDHYKKWILQAQILMIMDASATLTSQCTPSSQKRRRWCIGLYRRWRWAKWEIHQTEDQARSWQTTRIQYPERSISDKIQVSSRTGILCYNAGL